MKNKKILAVLLAMAMLLLCACSSNGGNNAANNAGNAANSGSNDSQTTEPAGNGGETTEPAEDAGTTTPAAPAEFDGTLHGPYIMTTCGQSTGSVMLHMIATQAGLTSTDEHGLTAEDLASKGSGCNTLIITTGTSGKGMGAAGTDINYEIERCSAVAEAAKEAGMTICIAHVEGMSRRTDANDQASIDSMLPYADVIMVVDESDSDGLFTDYATENNIPIIKAADTLSLGEYFA